MNPLNAFRSFHRPHDELFLSDVFYAALLYQKAPTNEHRNISVHLTGDGQLQGCITLRMKHTGLYACVKTRCVIVTRL